MYPGGSRPIPARSLAGLAFKSLSGATAWVPAVTVWYLRECTLWLFMPEVPGEGRASAVSPGWEGE